MTGKYRRGQPLPTGSRGVDGFGPKMFTDENLVKTEAWTAFAASHGHTLLELAMSWLASRPAVASIIAGAKTAAQAKANGAAAGWRLSEAELAEVARLL